MLTVLGALVARAGGGNSFSGGGGGGGGGGLSGGGGGGFFVGGGGGGGGGIGLVVAIVVVLVLVGILATVRRGRMNASGAGAGGGGFANPIPPAGSSWTGSEQPAISSIRGDLFPGSHPAAQAGAGGSVADGLAEIKGHDVGFNEEGFLEQVQRAFFVVQEAWTGRKPDMSRQVMADGLWQQHRVQIQQYVDGHKHNVLDGLAVGDLTIVGAHSDQTYDTVTVRVLAACADYDVDDASGKVVRGNKQVEQWQEDWTFQRASSSTTRTDGGTLSSKCPNCGAPLNLDLEGVCSYCHAPVMSGKYDWVLARISQVRV